MNELILSRRQLATALDAKLYMSNNGIQEIQKDHNMPNIMDLEEEAKSLHSTLAMPLIKELVEKQAQTTVENQLLKLATEAHDKVKKAFLGRIKKASHELFPQEQNECVQIRMLFLSLLSRGTSPEQQTRRDLISSASGHYVDRDKPHNQNCSDMFSVRQPSNGPVAKNSRASNHPGNICFCELLYKFALMALYGFQLLSLPEHPTEDDLKHYDKIPIKANSSTSNGRRYHRVLWPPIKLPSTGFIVKGKLEILTDPMDVDLPNMERPTKNGTSTTDQKRYSFW